MNNTSAIKNRMKSIRQTVNIANAQKLIASSRIGKARRTLTETAPYHENIRQSIAEIMAISPELESNYKERAGAPHERRGLLVLTANRGLVGGYNTNLIKAAEQSLLDKPTEQLIVTGSVGRSHLSKKKLYRDEFGELVLEPPTMYSAREIAERITGIFDSGEVDGFDIIYTHFTSSVRIAVRETRLFPLSPDYFGVSREPDDSMLFVPSPEAVLETLLPKCFTGFIYGCLLHAWASELTSRIMAMDSAIRNGNEILEKLTLIFNRARQAIITQEITEIVAGATAMSEE